MFETPPTSVWRFEIPYSRFPRAPITFHCISPISLGSYITVLMFLVSPLCISFSVPWSFTYPYVYFLFLFFAYWTFHFARLHVSRVHSVTSSLFSVFLSHTVMNEYTVNISLVELSPAR